MGINEKNLYDFYRLIGSGKFAVLAEGNGYSAVLGSHGSWPQIIFDIRSEKSTGLFLQEVFSDAAENHFVDFAVCNKNFITPVDQELLRLNEIFPVGTWQLMEINSPGDLNYTLQDHFTPRRLNGPAEINEFVSLVNADLMKKQMVNGDLLQELVQHECVDVFGLYSGNELVSGLLAYKGLNKVAGLYFITTKPEYRGKGLAAGITGEAVKSLFRQGAGTIVLQAVPKAVTLYARLGFTHKGELVILWKK